LRVLAMKMPLTNPAGLSAAALRVFIGLNLVSLFPTPAIVQNADPRLALPRMHACLSTEHPLLPPKWRGVFLMAPFTSTQLALSEIIHDGALPATLVRLFGVRSGAAELLVVDNKTYLLGQSGEANRCEDLGDTGWTPLPRDWLAERAQCVGAAPLADTPVEWWKTPVQPAPLTDWVWFKSSDQTPFRLLFEKPSERVSVLSSYALSYQVKFDVLADSELPSLVAYCRHAKQGPVGSGQAALRRVLDGMKRSDTKPHEEIKRLLPELAPSCPYGPPPAWPETAGMTLFLTPLDFRTNPLPTEVQYNWKLRSQRTRMFWPTDSAIATEDALMRAHYGYNVTRKRNGEVHCLAALPGTPRPGWMAEAPCTCEAVINGVTPLTPYGGVQILRCPATKPRLFWTWHTLEGRPMVFLVTPSTRKEPTALITLADYYTWSPEYVPEEAAFDRPQQCPNVENGSEAKSAHPRTGLAEPCRLCHLTPDRPR
jgi:hypothetical protein